MQSLRHLIPPILAFATAASAQTSDQSPPTRVDEWLVPIHSAPADPVGGPYGTWAAGPGFKASFHGGFTFYPYLGAAYPRNLPVAWRTESIQVGGAPVADLSVSAEQEHTDWRYEYRFDGVTEAYDVSEEGVEQSFVLHAAPAGAGDLVITGLVSTELRAGEQSAQHGAIRFHDEDGNPLVEYGAAFAFDAAGRSTDVSTGFDGQRLTLVVDGDWLGDATYPVTVDPLTSRIWLYGAPGPTGGGQVLDSDTVLPGDGRKTDPHLTFVVHSREFSGGDIDAYGQMMNHSLTNKLTIWTDLSASWSTIRPRCAHVGQEELWLATFERKLSSGRSLVRVYRHPRADRRLNTGAYFYMSAPTGLSHLRPDIGGSVGFNNSSSDCLLVFEQRTTGSSSGRVYGSLFDPLAGTFSTAFSLERTATSLVTQLKPSVITHALGTRSFPWMVAWQERSSVNTSDDWDLYVNQVHANGNRSQEALVGPHASASIDGFSPIVSGDWGRYLIAYSRGPRIVPTQVGYQRFDWPATAARPTVLPERTLRRPMTYFGKAHAVAFDLNTQSHWAILYQNSTGILGAIRVGHTGGTTESVTVHNFGSGAGAGGAGFSNQFQDFVFTYADVDLLFPLYGRRLAYPVAGVSPYGTSCNAGAGLVKFSDPYAGNGRFGLVFGFPSGLTTNAFILAAPFSGGWGIPGAGSCRVYLDSSTLFVASSAFGVSHNEFFAVPLPDDPVFFGEIYFQGVYLNAGANPLGIETTNALRVRVY